MTDVYDSQPLRLCKFKSKLIGEFDSIIIEFGGELQGKFIGHVDVYPLRLWVAVFILKRDCDSSLSKSGVSLVPPDVINSGSAEPQRSPSP